MVKRTLNSYRIIFFHESTSEPVALVIKNMWRALFLVTFKDEDILLGMHGAFFKCICTYFPTSELNYM